MMCYNPTCGGVPPTFYETYVRQIQDTIVENARNEFRAIWICNQRGISKVQATKLISSHALTIAGCHHGAVCKYVQLRTREACQTSIGTCSTSCDATTSWCGWYFTARAQKLRGGCRRRMGGISFCVQSRS
ncbi:unnamed protein product [Durusdinium trenchii]|uniref:Uncharacterized protein n=1 Tax=Durusdinium trenchii TaxID=1381693 RepID=A0ABP0LKQ6_9DINO